MLVDASEPVHLLDNRLAASSAETRIGGFLHEHEHYDSSLYSLAEGVGFEPTEACASRAFQARRFGRSRTPPNRHGVDRNP